MSLSLMELIKDAPWREAVTYRETWPHEYVLREKDSQQDLFAAIIPRFKDNEGIQGRFFNTSPTYLFLGSYKYWFMSPLEELEQDTGGEFVLNRARLFYDRRDFIIQPGDTRFPEDYPAPPLGYTNN